MNILFTCAGRRNYLINYFKETLKGDGLVVAADMDKTAPALVDADIAIEVESIYHKDYINQILDIVKMHTIDAIISLNDLELPILAKHKQLFRAQNVQVIVSDTNVIDIAFDKYKTHQFLQDIGLNSPKTYITLSSAIDAIKTGELSLPVIVKPRWGSDEYGVDIVNDLNGNHIGSFARKKLKMRSGETDKAASIIDKRFEDVGKIIGTHLKHIGNADSDVFLVNNELYVLEINPRFGGGYPFSHEAGVNIVAMYVNWLKGKQNVEQFNNYKAGVLCSKCDRLLIIKK